MVTLSEYAAQFIGDAYEWPAFDWCGTYVQAWLEYYGMTEKKTFKLSEDLTLDYNTDSWRSEEWGWEVGGEVFPDDLYDVEITFTKKPRPIKITSVVRHRNWPVWLDSGKPIYFVVKAIVGDKAWIGYKDQNHEDMLTSLDRLYFDE